MSADHAHDHSHDHSHEHDHEHAGPTPDFEASAEEAGATSRRVVVTVAAAAVDAAYDRAYADLARGARVKGFRKGKVPRSVLKQLYGPSLGEDLERVLVGGTLQAALERTGVEAVSPPSIDAETPRQGAPFQYTALVDVRPAIELPELEGLPGTRPVELVGDEDVERELEALRQRNAVIVEEAEGTAAENGHILSVDYVGRIDGEVFEGGSARDVDLELGSGRFIPGFEEQLLGACAEEDRELRVTFPENYDPSLAGREAVFQVHVAAVKRREVPALDDDFARDLGEFDTLDALRDQVHTDLREAQEQRADTALRRSVVTSLLERCTFDVPPAAVDQQLEARLRQAAQDMLRSGIPEETLAPQIEQWRSEWRPAAESEVRERWVLDAVAEGRELEVSEEEVGERVEQLASGQGLTPEALREHVDLAALERSLQTDLRREKALDFIVATAKVEDATNT